MKELSVFDAANILMVEQHVRILNVILISGQENGIKCLTESIKCPIALCDAVQFEWEQSSCAALCDNLG
jgi:hypothetical protein